MIIPFIQQTIKVRQMWQPVRRLSPRFYFYFSIAVLFITESSPDLSVPPVTEKRKCPGNVGDDSSNGSYGR